MLFVPWRQEPDILGSFESYQDRYHTLETTIKEKESEYNYNSGTVSLSMQLNLLETQLRIYPVTLHQVQNM